MSMYSPRRHIRNNDNLVSIAGLRNLKGGLPGSLRVRSNAKLASVSGLEGVTRIEGRQSSASLGVKYIDGNDECKTTGGTAPEGTPCAFPFTYDGVEYTACTTANNNGVPWCAGEASYGPGAIRTDSP